MAPGAGAVRTIPAAMALVPAEGCTWVAGGGDDAGGAAVRDGAVMDAHGWVVPVVHKMVVGLGTQWEAALEWVMGGGVMVANAWGVVEENTWERVVCT